MKRRLIVSLSVLLVGAVPASADELLGVRCDLLSDPLTCSLPAPRVFSVTAGCWPAPCSPNNVWTWLTPFVASEGGVVNTWRAQFLSGQLGFACLLPSRIQLKVLRMTSPTTAQIVAAGAVHDPKVLFEAQRGWCPALLSGSAESMIEFTESGVQIAAGDVLGLTIGTDPTVGQFVYPFVRTGQISRYAVRDVAVGDAIDVTDISTGTNLGVPAMQGLVEALILDSDGDGVADVADACPGSAPGTVVDARGCPLDSDGDGVADGADACPGSAPGTVVDASGCPLDRDGDGLPDFADACPDSPAGAVIDASGCSIDDYCPCAGPPWRNHGEYVSCVSHAADAMLLAGVIDEAQKDAAVSAAGASTCGAGSDATLRQNARRSGR